MVASQLPNQSHYRYQSGSFSLFVNHRPATTEINISFSIPQLHTSHFPQTYNLLSKRLPRVLYSRCFNDRNIPFSLEVLDTEIGHLFEHILLEYLCFLKLSSGFRSAYYRGETSWDWRTDQRGTFNIRIGAGISDQTVFPQALEKSIQLLHEIIGTNTGDLPCFTGVRSTSNVLN